MKRFVKGEIPDMPFRKAVKKPIPVQCIQIQEAFEVETLEGVLRGKPGDYLMVGIEGEMYPCEQEIFEKTYDMLDEQA